ncbi:copine-7-like isoform X2 [Xenia sp. Carnegie-2017]|nr:copine-7-like isoform X2 [Xenia sp. Carnegie-2017]
METCVTKVSLHISCKGLLDKDSFSKSDPLCAVYIFKDEHWTEYGRTERVGNNLNPEFSKSISVNYYFEMVQKLKFTVYDVDNETKKLNDDDYLGSMECTLGQIVSRKSFTEKLIIKDKKNAGTITVVAEELNDSNEIVQLLFHGKNLDKKDILGKSDPYLVISKQLPDGSNLPVHKTEICKNTLNPSFKMIEIPISELCNGDYDKKIMVKCFDWDKDTEHDVIGGFEVTLRELSGGKDHEISFPLVNEEKKAKKKKYVNSGVLYLSSFCIRKDFTFLDYIMGGCQVNFSVGVDFTASNGHPSNPTSLHFISPYSPNEYVQALVAVGSVCRDYDSDKMFPAYGFGAKLPPNYDRVAHDFALNFNPNNPSCQEIAGVVSAYQNCISCIELYGPTNVSPIINLIAKSAEKLVGTSSYLVLLLLTDGVLSDMSDAIDALVRASKLPMSVIIVGVGQADFTDMNTLDCDEGFLSSPRHGSAVRDIVQFVPFRDFKQDPVALAKAVLAEVPKQCVDYFKSQGIRPGNQ